MPGAVPDTSGAAGRLVVVGAGPAGLTAAYQYAKAGGTPVVLEASNAVGGIARTEAYDGYRFDIGGHRFFTKVPEVEELWHEILPHDFVSVKRLSRIFYKGSYYAYPLKLFNALANLGVYESFRILLSYAKWQVKPSRREDTFKQWVSNRFGRRLFNHFFKDYTEKVWGIPCSRIRADWAAQRIKDLSLRSAIMNAIGGAGSRTTSSLIDQFQYPRLGPGQLWERCRDLIVDAGGEVRMNHPVHAVQHDGSKVLSARVHAGDGETREVHGDQFITSMPIAQLIQGLDPAPPREVTEAAEALLYRDFLIVALIVRTEDPFPDNWIYVHSPTVKVGRIQNFRAWSEDMVPVAGHSSLGLEYFCQQGDGLWNSPDEVLIELAKNEIEALGLVSAADVVDGCVVRQEKAYPVYDEEYSANLGVIRGYLERFDNLHTVGRNGMHRYNNQDHSMLTAMLAVENILGADHDLWNVNVERSYHEELVVPQKRSSRRQRRADRQAATVEAI
jgi:protoporphyrinogen oxidase